MWKGEGMNSQTCAGLAHSFGFNGTFLINLIHRVSKTDRKLFQQLQIIVHRRPRVERRGGGISGHTETESWVSVHQLDTTMTLLGSVCWNPGRPGFWAAGSGLLILEDVSPVIQEVPSVMGKTADYWLIIITTISDHEFYTANYSVIAKI